MQLLLDSNHLAGSIIFFIELKRYADFILPCFCSLPQKFISCDFHLNSIPLLRNTPSGTLMILHWLSSSIWHEFKKFRPFKLIESMYIYVYSFVCSAILLPSYYFKSCVPRLQVTNLILSLVLLSLQFSHVFCQVLKPTHLRSINSYPHLCIGLTALPGLFESFL